MFWPIIKLDLFQRKNGIYMFKRALKLFSLKREEN